MTDPGRGTDDRASTQWHRVGISQYTGCDEALSGAVAGEAEKLGCEAVLRATYVDPTGNTVGTIGLIVLPESDSLSEKLSTFFDSEKDKRAPGSGVKAFPVKGTAAARWSDAHRNGSAGAPAGGFHMPYGVVASTGAVDGRRAGELPGEWGGSGIDAKQDRSPWTGAADNLVKDFDAHIGDLLLEETS